MKQVTIIPTDKGELRVWESSPEVWAWATLNGSQGSAEDGFEAAVSEAFHAEGLNPKDYGYENHRA